MIFYYAHPAVLYVNKLRVAGVLSDGLNAYFETIFETVRAAPPAWLHCGCLRGFASRAER